ncbi:MAG: 16S rRNA processing protein RimM [Acidobacteria bacterium]|nr:16S rRNA processing protein RimM [Acidobacteriota bacterium]
MAPAPESEYLTIARIRKTRGRRGEVAAEVLTDFPDRFQAGREFLLSKKDVQLKGVLEESWFHKSLAILKFRGVDSISAAKALVGCWVEIPIAERRQLPPRVVYISDLIGCTVREEDHVLGEVAGWEETGAVPLLSVRTPQGELLIPFAEEICRSVNVTKKEIQVILPEGLKELNRRERRSRARDFSSSGGGNASKNDASKSDD